MDDDLTRVVTHLTSFKRDRHGSTMRDPNDPEVRLFMEAGVAALAANFSERVHVHRDGWTAKANDMTGAITISEVMTHFRHLGDAGGLDVGFANKSRLEKWWGEGEWASYQDDLVSYVFRDWYHEARMRDIHRALPSLMTLPFGQLVQHLAQSETDDVQSEPLIRLQLALQTLYPEHRLIQSRAAQVYERQIDAWVRVYEIILDAYRLDLRPALNVTVHDMAIAFNMIVEGAYIRRQANPELGEFTDGTHAAVRTIQLLVSQIIGIPWEDLASRLARPAQTSSGP